ncbi:EamA family transporter [Alicyclobacillus fastidiosus]|uniref:EamA family transporter n=1 Tax=Alicyclobacillus fastidiosus TaxID=392011 RepID=UPI003D67C45C
MGHRPVHAAGARIRGKQWWLILGIGLANAAVSYCYYQALTVLPASFGIILLFQFAWMTVVMDIIVKRKWPSATKWVGLAIIFLGTGLAVGMKRGEWQHMPLWAVGLGLLSALSYAINLYLSEYNDPAVSPSFGRPWWSPLRCCSSSSLSHLARCSAPWRTLGFTIGVDGWPCSVKFCRRC